MIIRNAYSGQILYVSSNTSGFDFTGKDLQRADLRGLDLRNSFFRGTRLQGSIFDGANLSGSDMSFANCRGSLVTDVDMTNVDLSGADLSGCNLCASRFTGAILDTAILRAVSYCDLTVWPVGFEPPDLDRHNADAVMRRLSRERTKPW